MSCTYPVVHGLASSVLTATMGARSLFRPQPENHPLVKPEAQGNIEVPQGILILFLRTRGPAPVQDFLGNFHHVWYSIARLLLFWFRTWIHNCPLAGSNLIIEFAQVSFLARGSSQVVGNLGELRDHRLWPGVSVDLDDHRSVPRPKNVVQAAYSHSFDRHAPPWAIRKDQDHLPFTSTPRSEGEKNLWTTCLKDSKNLVSTNQPFDGRPTLLHNTIRILPTFILGPDIY
ncbi:hypothetical protein EV421DRAFT_2019197 [Armillaria borealis]|uniref:Uncharacterized protein n=1 Tax=Armillaria borealis TaxID=47425 RepID=A0AA39MQE4_9AGAR|nr:hypothetical protein EV421DRAFT_2019197 [Armillaria borealis]